MTLSGKVVSRLTAIGHGPVTHRPAGAGGAARSSAASTPPVDGWPSSISSPHRSTPPVRELALRPGHLDVLGRAGQLHPQWGINADGFPSIHQTSIKRWAAAQHNPGVARSTAG